MTPDPKRSPIAALRDNWRGRIEEMDKYGPAASDFFRDCLAELEAAIAAQVEVWSETVIGRRFARDLKGEP